MTGGWRNASIISKPKKEIHFHLFFTGKMEERDNGESISVTVTWAEFKWPSTACFSIFRELQVACNLEPTKHTHIVDRCITKKRAEKLSIMIRPRQIASNLNSECQFRDFYELRAATHNNILSRLQ